MSLDGIRTYDQWKEWQRQIMAKKPKRRKNTKGILGNKIVGPKKLGISAAAATAPAPAGAGSAGGK